MWDWIVGYTVWVFVGFIMLFGLGSCWLVWRKAKDKREQIDIDKRMEILQMVKISPEDSARMRQRIREAVREEFGDERAERICPEPEINGPVLACPACHGTGLDRHRRTPAGQMKCVACSGRGTVPAYKPPDEEIHILQMAPTEIKVCSRGPMCSRDKA